jgi:hypothetical protein
VEQELFQNVKVFLEKERKCSNVESEVPIAERAPQLRIKGLDERPREFGRIDVVGGRFFGGNHIELHCVEHKSAQDDIIKGIGQLFWYKFSMSQLQTWAERLFLYLLIDEDRVSEELRRFCKSFGFGLLQINRAKIVTEAVTPENQNGLIARAAQDETKLTCPKCYKNFRSEELKCPQCGTGLKTQAPWLWNLFADTFVSSSTNRKYQGAPSSMPPEIQQTPLLKKVFANWSRVQEAWNPM